MDVAGFIDLLTKSGLDVTPLEVAEAIWLAQYAAPPARQAAGEPAPQLPEEQEPQTEGQAGVGDQRGASREPADRLPVYLPSSVSAVWTSPAGTGTGMPVPVPASIALPGSLALMRALRPLKLRAPDIRRPALDETATVEATARSGALRPVL
ncbi:MAG: hypothetical protein ABSB76_40360, partial [Streptosporangiaceae bacterium]